MRHLHMLIFSRPKSHNCVTYRSLCDHVQHLPPEAEEAEDEPDSPGDGMPHSR